METKHGEWVEIFIISIKQKKNNETDNTATKQSVRATSNVTK